MISTLTFSTENPPSLFAQYIKEREGLHIIENDEAFATYQFLDKMIYITDIYVIPEYRQLGVASKIAETIAEIGLAKGCEYMLGSVDPSTNNATYSAMALMNFGFALYSLDKIKNLIYFRKAL